MQRLDLRHHLLINRQTTCGIDNQYVVEFLLSVINCSVSDINRFLIRCGREEINA
ncbi:Uncharacterised protein [Vibrio cholerae]|nr:Uncharacterised protein [Vibrio cholerae]